MRRRPAKGCFSTGANRKRSMSGVPCQGKFTFLQKSAKKGPRFWGSKFSFGSPQTCFIFGTLFGPCAKSPKIAHRFWYMKPVLLSAHENHSKSVHQTDNRHKSPGNVGSGLVSAFGAITSRHTELILSNIGRGRGKQRGVRVRDSPHSMPQSCNG